MNYASDVAFTPAVKKVQTERGSRKSYARMEEQRGGFEVAISGGAAEFIAERDSAYLATANVEGQPYVQHRGGPKGFLHVIDEHTIAFADFVGNRQYITTGNLSENDRAFLFLMDYEHRTRLKFWGRARIVDDDAALLERLTDPEDGTRVEQAIVFTVKAWDANCPQHIPVLVHATDVADEMKRLRERIEYLESALRESNVPFADD